MEGVNRSYKNSIFEVEKVQNVLPGLRARHEDVIIADVLAIYFELYFSLGYFLCFIPVKNLLFWQSR